MKARAAFLLFITVILLNIGLSSSLSGEKTEITLIAYEGLTDTGLPISTDSLITDKKQTEIVSEENIQPMQTYFLVESVKKNKRENINAEISLVDSEGKKSAEILTVTKNYQKEGLFDSTIKLGKYDAELSMEEGPVQNIKFYGVDIGKSPEIGIDDVNETGENAGWTEIFAIDPTKLEFESAVVTAVAKGTVLYKCKDWNFTEQRCYGEWVKLMDLARGQEYSFALTPEDPAFGEIIPITKAMHLDENKSIIEDIYEEVKERDDIWKEVPEGHYARVTFSQNLTSRNDITIYAKSDSGGSVEAYEKDSDELIAGFGLITEDKKYQILLTGLRSPQDTFDLKVTGGNVSFDYIVDPSWPNTTFTKCRNITITNAGATTLTSFPAYINLTYDSDMQPDYADLRFYNSSCGTNGASILLNYEIENYTAANAHIWVNIPTLPTGNKIISVYYSNTTGVSSGQNPTAVWDSNFVGVWHMANINATDSTSNGINGTAIGITADPNNQKIDGAINFTGKATSYINLRKPSSLNFTGFANFTITAWVMVKGNAGTQRAILNKGETQYNLKPSSANRFELCVYNGSYVCATDTANIVNNQWYFVAGINNGTNTSIWINGAYKNSAKHATGITANTYNATIGRSEEYAQYLNGTIDELEVSNVSRSADWINQSFQMVANQGSFVTVAGEETYSAGDALPNVTLSYPADNYVNSTSQYVNITFNASVTDDYNIKNCSLWHNITGTWTLNQSQNVTGTSNITTYILTNLVNKTFIWNIQCYDNASQASFASANRTVILNWTDTTPPAWNPLPSDQTIEYGTAFSYDANATDLQTITYSINDTTRFAVNSASGLITNNTLLAVGTYSLRINATDASNNINSTTITITVQDTTKPQWNPLPSSQTSEYGSSFSYDVDATDLQTITYSINDTTNFQINSATGLITNKTSLAVRAYSLQINATDASSNVNSTTITITVQDTTKPVWNPLPANQTIEYGTAFSYDANATDLQTITYSVNDTTRFAVGSSTGIITNNTLLAIGTYSLQINATDASSNINSTTITITVQDTTPPAWNPLPSDQTSEYGASFSYDVDAADLQTITYSINDTTNFQINSATGVITNKTSLVIKIYSLRINATDASNNVNSTVIAVTVQDTIFPASVTNLNNQSAGLTWIYWNWTNPTDADFSQAIVYINGTNTANTSNNYYNYTSANCSTTYNITVHTKDSNGNVNNTNVNNITSTLACAAAEEEQSVSIEWIEPNEEITFEDQPEIIETGQKNEEVSFLGSLADRIWTIFG